MSKVAPARSRPTYCPALGTSVSGTGGGGTEALGSAIYLDVDIADISAVASSLRSFHIPDVDDHRRAASANRSARRAAVNSSLPPSTPSYSGILAALARWIKYRLSTPPPPLTL